MACYQIIYGTLLFVVVVKVTSCLHLCCRYCNRRSRLSVLEKKGNFFVGCYHYRCSCISRFCFFFLIVCLLQRLQSLVFSTTSLRAVCVSVCKVDGFDHAVQQKVEISTRQDRIASWLPA